LKGTDAAPKNTINLDGFRYGCDEN